MSSDYYMHYCSSYSYNLCGNTLMECCMEHNISAVYSSGSLKTSTYVCDYAQGCLNNAYAYDVNYNYNYNYDDGNDNMFGWSSTWVWFWWIWWVIVVSSIIRGCMRRNRRLRTQQTTVVTTYNNRPAPQNLMQGMGQQQPYLVPHHQ